MKSKRRNILKTAEHDFLEKGYDGTSIDSIVREVGGSKSTVYSHFRDKRVLFAAALADVQREFDFRLVTATAQQASSIHERLIFMGVELLTLLYGKRAIHLLRTLVAESKRFPEVGRQFIEDGLEVAVQAIAEVIDNAVAAGELSAQPAGPQAARDFVALLTADLHLKLLLGLEPLPGAEEIADRAEHAAARLFTRSSPS